MLELTEILKITYNEKKKIFYVTAKNLKSKIKLYVFYCTLKQLKEISIEY